MKYINNLLLIIAFVAVLSACGGDDQGGENNQDNNKVLVARPVSTKLLGELSDYFEIIDKEYKIKDSEGNKRIDIEFKRLDKPFPLNPREEIVAYSSDNGLYISLGIETLDDDGELVEKFSPDSYNLGTDDVLVLSQLNPGDLEIVEFILHKDFTKFRITSLMKRVGDDHVEDEADNQ